MKVSGFNIPIQALDYCEWGSKDESALLAYGAIIDGKPMAYVFVTDGRTIVAFDISETYTPTEAIPPFRFRFPVESFQWVGPDGVVPNADESIRVRFVLSELKGTASFTWKGESEAAVKLPKSVSLPLDFEFGSLSKLLASTQVDAQRRWYGLTSEKYAVTYESLSGFHQITSKPQVPVKTALDRSLELASPDSVVTSRRLVLGCLSGFAIIAVTPPGTQYVLRNDEYERRDGAQSESFDRGITKALELVNTVHKHYGLKDPEPAKSAPPKYAKSTFAKPTRRNG